MNVESDSQDELLSTRQKIVRWALWGVQNEPRVHYSQRRPIDGIRQPGKLPLYVDCSGFVTLCYSWAGAPDPNGLKYSGQGYTGTLLKHCRPIAERDLLPADLVVFGGGTGSHVVLVIGKGASADVVSHGTEGAPDRYSLAKAKTYFARPARPVRCPNLGAFIIGEEDPDDSGPPALDPGIPIDPEGSNPPAGSPME